MLRFGHDVCRLEQNAPVFVDPHQEPRIRLTWEDSTASRVSFDNRRFHAAILPPIFPQWEQCAVKRSLAISPLLSPEQQVRTRDRRRSSPRSVRPSRRRNRTDRASPRQAGGHQPVGDRPQPRAGYRGDQFRRSRANPHTPGPAPTLICGRQRLAHRVRLLVRVLRPSHAMPHTARPEIRPPQNPCATGN